uniref:Xanthine dehydrogenase accessory factor n=1 Tax=Candidatus Kentrum sp. FM TaxID=2126340 RepID=A0A450TI66_9GAMM|nr:MAG: xanthine dehydrogenase accessory factor [Candidatus Kentron sp. FM]VFJ71200.1 MAG: xanthine dehydrogenase accessory factor [Candidatus Kentron sp. FM]VFK18148.1 MAG: xanthine dehydrogenase accessory factor [Candidatus Kentron sp. FM]
MLKRVDNLTAHLNTVVDCLRKGIPVALLLVVESDGSAPGRIGFKMAVAADGRLAGTIGGGIVEHKFVELAREKLNSGDPAPLLRRQVHDHGAKTDRSGMICGGTQTIALYPCRKTDLPVIERLTESPENHGSGILRLSPSGLSFLPGRRNSENHRFRLEAEDEWLYEENIGFLHTAYIIGGGHVGQALSRVLAMLDFHVVILDERPDVGASIDNTHAGEKITVSYREIRQYIPDGDRNYVIIMTPNHKADKRVLEQLLDKKIRYLGMMGSARKVNEIFGQLRDEGAPPERLQHVHAPIGLPIGSHTPSEIAVSIAAEMISLKNRKYSGHLNQDKKSSSLSCIPDLLCSWTALPR